ncbi:conserved hypothetical protein [Acidovorax delafieldii 2AN]|uniref:Flagellar protein FlgN n=1 Tax=Acidovorax delafieldii 2AN TaxID=573060 RepID=C5T222_ACIDE|nr:hypothetical protein [Acidovorax delafieldii]EER61512.1 conserved hypothetical protein [Acidovorax delafieldii 2AN]
MQTGQALAAVEQQIQDVSAALLAADPQTLEKCSVQLRDAAAGLARMMAQSAPAGAFSPAVQKRLESAAAQLSVQRESLARLAAVADRQLKGLLPSSDAAATYGNALGGKTQGGVARIYRSAS